MTKACQQCKTEFKKPTTTSLKNWAFARFCGTPCYGQSLRKPAKIRLPVVRKPLTAEHKAKIVATRRANGSYDRGGNGRSAQGLINSTRAKKNWKLNHREAVNFHTRLRRYRLRGAEGSHTLQEWESLKAQYGNMCLCCKLIEPTITLTEDHVRPISLGGTNDISNIQPLCKSCNSRKFLAAVDYRVETCKASADF